ncbi:MAG: hypothetical protein ACRDI1_00055 [Actinomycetota bacterium]
MESSELAWHRDRIKKEIEDPIVVLVSLGGGDLLVTGGKFQREWEHTMPKVKEAGPRISIAFRHGMATKPY